MNKSIKSNNEFINEVIFLKETIKTLEDTVYYYYPKNYCEILPYLHKAYDTMSVTLYRLNKNSK